jgi:hypothetical protein
VKRSRRDEPIGAVIYIHGNNTRKLPVYLSLSQTSKTAMFLFLSFMFFLLQNQRTEGWHQFCRVGRRVGTSRKGRWWGKGEEDEYSENNVYTCM